MCDLIAGPSFKPKKIIKTRPFNNSREFEPHKDRWVFDTETGDVSKVTNYNDSNCVINGKLWWYINAVKRFKFHGTNDYFGIKVMEYEG